MRIAVAWLERADSAERCENRSRVFQGRPAVANLAEAVRRIARLGTASLPFRSECPGPEAFQRDSGQFRVGLDQSPQAGLEPLVVHGWRHELQFPVEIGQAWNGLLAA